MSTRERILSSARQLAIGSGTVPSMDAIAAAAGVSKGGFTHHFKSRAALLEGLAAHAIASTDEALGVAVGRGDVVETWLRLSMAGDDAALYRAILMSFADVGESAGVLLSQSAEASERWERLLAAELGDPVAASVIRLVGDGLVMSALTGDKLPSLEALLGWLEQRKAAP